MYKFMIVDDDKLVRKRILSAIPLEKLGLTLCGEAEDGVQALELFDRCRPQIAIMDINIPFLNGLEVAKQIRDEDPEINIIIVTGYGTVDTARAAIRGGMVDFLLKPINFKELEQILSKIVDKLILQSKQALEQQRMERLLERGMPLLRNKYFLSLMQTPAENLTEDACRQYLSDFGINETPKEICVAIVVPNYDGISVEQQMSMQAVLETELQKMLETVGIGCIVVYDSMQRAILITYGGEEHLNYALEQKISLIRDKMRYIYCLDLCASIGSIVHGFHELQKSYQHAEHALSYWSILENNNIISSENLSNIDISTPQLPSMRHSEIMDLLISADEQKLHDALSDYLNQLINVSRNSVHNLQLQAVELVALLFSCARELGEDVTPLLTEKPLPYVRILSSNNANTIQRTVWSTAQKIMENLHGQREQSKNRALSSAKLYIMQNSSNPELNLARVAEHVNLSPSYVSHLFKRIDNCTFTEYLNSVRIEHAKKLLSTTHMRVYEVSDAVGYQNSKYFFQLFKQLTGKRPREYYEAVGNEEASDSRG